MKKMSKLKKIILIILTIIIIAILGVADYTFSKGYAMYKASIKDFPIKECFSEIQDQENFMSVDEVPDIFIDAVISVEDKRFYSHRGIDLLSVGRAILTDLRTLDFTEGGSTITQQIAKNEYFTQEKHFSRKVAEVFVARDIEKLYKKDDIIEIYINTNYYGSGYYGIYDASWGYYEKDPIDLTDYEATLLAGVPNAPSVYSPKVNLNLAEKRQDKVLEKMVNAKKLTQSEMKAIQDQQITK